MENKTSKYFKYALGEIVLVVIGILIAVQINTALKNAEIRKSNKIYLTKIVEELNLNKERLHYLAFTGDTVTKSLSSLEKVINDCNAFLEITGRGIKESDLEFLLSAQLYAGGSQLNLFDATYEELLNTGKLYTLSSDTIILAIKNYYKRYEREIEYNRRWTDFALEGLNKLETNFRKIELDYSYNKANFSFTDYPWFFDSKSEKYTAMQMGVQRLLGGQKHDLRKCKELIHDTDVLIALLNKELSDKFN